MPTYTFLCKNCENRFEFFQKMSDNPPSQCPNCVDPDISLIITGGSTVIFNGGGWSGTGMSTPSHVKIVKKDGRSRSKTKSG